MFSHKYLLVYFLNNELFTILGLIINVSIITSITTNEKEFLCKEDAYNTKLRVHFFVDELWLEAFTWLNSISKQYAYSIHYHLQPNV